MEEIEEALPIIGFDDYTNKSGRPIKILIEISTQFSVISPTTDKSGSNHQLFISIKFKSFWFRHACISKSEEQIGKNFLKTISFCDKKINTKDLTAVPVEG